MKVGSRVYIDVDAFNKWLADKRRSPRSCECMTASCLTASSLFLTWMWRPRVHRPRPAACAGSAARSPASSRNRAASCVRGRTRCRCRRSGIWDRGSSLHALSRRRSSPSRIHYSLRTTKRIECVHPAIDGPGGMPRRAGCYALRNYLSFCVRFRENGI